jgi:hypothetical protein
MRSEFWSKAGEHNSELKIQDPAGRIGDCRSRGSLVMIVVRHMRAVPEDTTRINRPISSAVLFLMFCCSLSQSIPAQGISFHSCVGLWIHESPSYPRDHVST